MQSEPYGVMFHHFYSDKHPKGQGAISADQLADMIEYLGPKNIISADEWVEGAGKRGLKPGKICLTFDDALLCQYDVALPVLQHYKITAFWFVYSSVISGGVEMLEVYRKFRTVKFSDVEDFYAVFFEVLKESQFKKLVENSLYGFSPKEYLSTAPFYTNNDRKFRYLRDKVLGPSHYHKIMNLMLASYGIDIKEFSKDLWMREDHLHILQNGGHIIGSHSHSHPTELTKLSGKDQRAEYETSIFILNKILGEVPRTMSHPCNSYNQMTLKILEDLGFTLGFRANMARPVLSQLEYPREDHANIVAVMKI